jgi:preprotein translocase subunit SecA
MMEAIKEESVGFLFNVDVQVEEPPPPPVLDMNALVATGPGENPGEIVAEPLAGEAPAVAPVGVAAEPVPSAAPAAFVQEQSLDIEQPGAAPAPAAPPAAHGVLPETFGRPDRPANLQYTAPAVDGAAGRGGTTSPAGPMSMTSVGEGARPGQAASTEQSRNAPCHCGSGKKYKRCHGDPRNR